MLVKRILKIVMLLLGGTYIVLKGLALREEGAAVGTFALVILTCYYVVWTKHKSKFFLWFLVAFTFGQIVGLAAWYAPKIKPFEIDVLYYLANILFIIAYGLLILKIIRGFDLRKVFLELTIPIIVLVILDIFCVTLISGTTEGMMSYSEYILEYTYNGVVMALLSFALINYMYRNNNKSMLFLLGSIFMVFSEIIQLAYYYILQDANLGYVYSFLLVVAFIFFYMQSQLKVTEPIPDYSDEPLEV